MIITQPETIAAVATPPGIGAIAVLRVSGTSSREIAARVSGARPESFAHRTVSVHQVVDADGAAIDRAVFTYYRAPASFTGEDVLEVSCHGGLAAVRSVLRAIIAAGARPAQPGEFTKRAFLNGKMDLAQAEAVNDLIRARTETQMSAARQTLDGALSRKVRQAWAALTEIAAQLEASIDFPEDVEEPGRSAFAEELAEAASAIREVTEMAERGQMLSAGVRLAIVGRPNTGKSSLLNLLANRARAIVSDIPGTTRDYLEETVDIGGLPVVAVDTAGLRETGDPVEQEGARLSGEALRQADAALLVVDAREQISQADMDVLEAARERVVAVWNKSDLLQGSPPASKSDPALEDVPTVQMSALSGEGLADLEEAILSRLGAGRGFFDEALSASERQVTALKTAEQRVWEARASALTPLALDLAAVQIQAARSSLAEITGENVSESLVDAIFSSFCIGK